MTKSEFYESRSVMQTDWWIEDYWLLTEKKLVWARLRVFDNEKADVSFGETEKLYGFDNPEYAGYFLSEDEYCPVSSFDKEDEVEYGISLEELVPPIWEDAHDQEFSYIGTY
jgi:hypothetical protein